MLRELLIRVPPPPSTEVSLEGRCPDPIVKADRSLEALSEISERLEEVDGSVQDEAEDGYKELPWGAASSPAAVAEVVARILATDDQLRPRAEVLVPACAPQPTCEMLTVIRQALRDMLSPASVRMAQLLKRRLPHARRTA